ncbi:ryncolin-1-like [Amphiura filiformis]|uniref:ryncolin-1-like n=1 Tax=Amphiura filiformis TaxID=82378 RepID=UPI003B20D261
MRVAALLCLMLAFICEGQQQLNINFCNIRCSHPHCSNPCQNGGSCTDGTGSFTCACATGYTGDTCDTIEPRDCFDIQQAGFDTSGVYTIYPASQGPIEVYCDMVTDGGGWLVFQRRKDGTVNFFRDWNSYKQGFGDRDSEFWLGNDSIFAITNQGTYELRVDMEANNGNSAYALYSEFLIGDENANYKLTVDGYDGTAGDSLGTQDQYQFSTKDEDNDGSDSRDCAVIRTGAWWYKKCGHSNLNGVYGDNRRYKGIFWMTFRGNEESLKRTEMKIRPVTTS